jgi:transposase
MSRTKEISEDPSSRIVDLHEAGKGYKSILKSLDVHRSTVRQMVYKWRKFSTVATLPRTGHPAKRTARAQRRMLNEVKKNPRVSAKDLKKSLEHANISVDESTIRETLNKNGVHGRTPRKKPLLCKKNIAVCLKFAKEHLDVPQRSRPYKLTERDLQVLKRVQHKNHLSSVATLTTEFQTASGSNISTLFVRGFVKCVSMAKQPHTSLRSPCAMPSVG